MLDLQQLRYFVAVAETENVGQAAELLHISQSPLSRQVQQLEARLGLVLFTREKKRLRLTAAGQEFLVEARALLAHAQRVQQRGEEAGRGEAGTLVVGYVAGAVHAGVLGAALRRFRTQVPGARLQLRSLRSVEQFDALARGELDVGYTYAPPPTGYAGTVIPVRLILGLNPWIVLSTSKLTPPVTTQPAASAAAWSA
ncbi:MAG: LysR family transcriptional regulator [Rhizobacter sp.]